MDYTNSNKHFDGHYDLKVNGRRIEVKTSCQTSKGVWQHEPLYAEEVCDLVIFIDFGYDFFHISVIPSKDLPLGRTSPYFINKKGLYIYLYFFLCTQSKWVLHINKHIILLFIIFVKLI